MRGRRRSIGLLTLLAVAALLAGSLGLWPGAWRPEAAVACESGRQGVGCGLEARGPGRDGGAAIRWHLAPVHHLPREFAIDVLASSAAGPPAEGRLRPGMDRRSLARAVVATGDRPGRIRSWAAAVRDLHLDDIVGQHALAQILDYLQQHASL
ncbi:MAG: hypothetical protein QN174_08805 [Armatimonadota bacterium]|nr:hypothetical protein [Armatimonadota bacterium]MDR7497043.1 hypothetical protein [Armatimonadota bacterium]MDR7512601.1 hypothetical protein [Armatimonadota bacterium]